MTVTVDTILPIAPIILSPLPGTTLNTMTPTFAGTAEPGSIVAVRDLVSGVIVGTGMTDELGSYSFTISVPLSNGSAVL